MGLTGFRLRRLRDFAVSRVLCGMKGIVDGCDRALKRALPGLHAQPVALRLGSRDLTFFDRRHHLFDRDLCEERHRGAARLRVGADLHL